VSISSGLRPQLFHDIDDFNVSPIIMQSFISLGLLVASALAAPSSRAATPAVTCANFATGTIGTITNGIKLSNYKTVVGFGVSDVFCRVLPQLTWTTRRMATPATDAPTGRRAAQPF
jgi:hydrogenase/urease accessory protein HupE